MQSQLNEIKQTLEIPDEQKLGNQLTQTVSNWEAKQLSPVKQSPESVNTEIDRNEELTESETSTVTPAQSEELLMHLKPLLDDF